MTSWSPGFTANYMRKFFFQKLLLNPVHYVIDLRVRSPSGGIIISCQAGYYCETPSHRLTELVPRIYHETELSSMVNTSGKRLLF